MHTDATKRSKYVEMWVDRQIDRCRNVEYEKTMKFI
jgi:hypothetical protein